MEKLLILNEKESAYENFDKDLGGTSGTFNGDYYDLVHSYGHLLQLKDPQRMVDSQNVPRYSNWEDLRCYPWNENDFHWTKEVKPGGLALKTLKKIKAAAPGHDAIVIATDNDPSGEGDLLGWEIVNAIGWKGKVYRIRFADESAKNVKKALLNKVDVTKQWEQGEFLEALGRERFDLLSMQLSRIALILEREAKYSPKTQRLGRLVSAIVGIVFEQTKKRDNYIKKPYFEIKFKDNNNNVFSRKYVEGESTFRLSNNAAAQTDLKNYDTSPIVVDSIVEKRKSPPALLDLGAISILVGKKGFTDKQIIDTYQKMYEAKVVSYPRTEDTKITLEQFNELSPFVNKIAKVVNVDPSLLTHLKPRKSFIVDAADHGANRPGFGNVPNSLAEVKKKWGDCGVAIYEAVAKSYLAMLADDYVYTQEKAHLEQYPSFKSSINVPKQLNYKKVFNEDSLQDEESDKQAKGFGKFANPFAYEGSNPKPSKPSKQFILNFLKRKSIGTGATRVQTLADISDGKRALMKVSKGSYVLNYEGQLQALISQNTMIASPEITKQLQDGMVAVKEKRMSYQRLPASMKKIVNHDLPVMEQNISSLVTDKRLQKLALKHKDPREYVHKEKVKGIFQGKKIEFSREFNKHRFSDEEVKLLLEGKEIGFDVISKKTKQKYVAHGKLAKQKYKGKTFYGFKPEFN